MMRKSSNGCGAECTLRGVIFEARSVIRTTPERLFAFHQLPDAIDRLTPAWEQVRIIERAPDLHAGNRAVSEVRVAPGLWIRLISEHVLYDPPRRFVDEQIRGPFRRWRHEHIVEPHAGGAVLIDRIDFQVPCRIAAERMAMRRLQRLFEYRHEVTRAWCER